MFGDPILELFQLIDQKLKSPDKKATEIEEKFMKEKFIEMRPIYDIVIDFIIKNDGVLYGGFALNEMLPNDLKFYDQFTLPDYDCFLKNASKKAVNLADVLIDNKYKYTEVKNALHENTFKVFTNFESVADFTQLNEDELDIIYHKSVVLYYKNNKKIRVCSRDLLKAFAYIELCSPVSASYRWIKVYKRLLMFENTFPVKSKSTKSLQNIISTNTQLPNTYDSIYSKFKKYFVDEKVVFSGVYSLHKHLGITVDKGAKYLEILSSQPEKHLKEVVEMANDMNTSVKVITNKKYNHLIPVNVDVYLRFGSKKYFKVLTIYDSSNQCISYFKHKDKLVSSIYFELYKCYIMRFLQEQENDELDLLIQTLTTISSRIDFKDGFTENCYGYSKSMGSIKKSIWDNNKKIVFYRPSKI